MRSLSLSLYLIVLLSIAFPSSLVSANTIDAMRLITKQGNTKAQFNLGVRYDDGHAMEKIDLDIRYGANGQLFLARFIRADRFTAGADKLFTAPVLVGGLTFLNI